MRAFIDSSVAVCRFLPAGDARQAAAEQLFDDHDSSGQLVVSTQVLLETYQALVTNARVSPKLALAAVQMLARYEVVAPTQRAAVAATELAAQHRLPVWDALVVQAALQADCDLLYALGIQHGRRFGNLEVVNPFGLSGASAGEAPASYAPLPAKSKAKPKQPALPARSGPRTPARPAAPSKPRRG